MTGEAGDDEAAWRDLVAHFSAAPAQGVESPWPAREDLPAPPLAAGLPGPPAEPDVTGDAGPPAADAGPPAAEEAAAGPDPVPGVIPSPPQVRIVRPAAPAPLPPASEEEHYVPPDPPPLPRLDPAGRLAWAALLGGPGYLLVSVMLGWTVPGLAAFIAVAAFVGGFATLVIRMGDGPPPPDSGPGDGAVV